LKAFTAVDLRFMLGQQISLPILMPMALDVLELDGGGESTRGTLLYIALKVDNHFWREHPRLWHRMNMVLGELQLFLDFIEQEVLPAAGEFQAARPG
jgi:hypothetical protein